MKLQVALTARDWTDVLHFSKENAAEVEDAAAMLSRAAGGVRLRIIDGCKVRELNSYGVFRVPVARAPGTGIAPPKKRARK